MITDSVKVVRELNLIDNERSFFHDTNENVLCKVVGLENVNIFKHSDSIIVSAEFNALGEVLEKLENNDFSRPMRKTMNYLTSALSKEREVLEIIIEIFNDRMSPSENEIKLISETLRRELNETNLMEDISKKFKLLVVDDGLTKHSLIAKKTLLRKVKLNDVISVDIQENEFLEENGYLLINEEIKYALKLAKVNS